MSDELIIEDGPDRNRLRVKLTEYETNPLVDVRLWYKDKSSGEFKPSRKGISLTRNNYLAVRSAITDSHDKIIEHLRVNTAAKLSSAEHKVVKSSRSDQLQPIEQVSYSIEAIRPASQLYQVDFEGSEALVRLNSGHALVENNRNKVSSEDVFQQLATLITSLELAKIQSDGAELTSPSVVLELMMDRMNRISARIAKVNK